MATTTKSGDEQLKRSLTEQTRLNRIIERIYEADSFADVFPEIEAELLSILNAERMTVYQRSHTEANALVSKFKSGDEIREIRLSLSPSSIAGYVALSQQALRIDDVYDAKALAAVNGKLQFDKSFDKMSGFRSRSMIVIPIKSREVLFGVLQLINRAGGGAFTEAEFRHALKMSLLIGQKLRYDLGGTAGPFDELVRRKKISQAQLGDITRRAKKQGMPASQLLMSEANVSAEELGKSLERYYQVPYQPYDPAIVIPTELLHGLNEAYLRKQLWVPLEGDRKEVVVLIDDPTDDQRIMEIQRVLRAEHYRFKVGLPEDIQRFLGKGGSGPARDVDIHDLVGRMQDEVHVEDEVEVKGEEVDENEATVIQLVNQLIVDAYNARASDIHIEPGRGVQPSSVRIRVDGACRHAFSIPSTHIRAVVSRIKIMAGLDISDRRRPQDGKCVIKYKGQPIELRVATIPTVHGESVVMRILASSKPLPLDKLNLAPRNYEELEKLIVHPHGIMLVVGPTGSGKTTTLHAVLGHINTPDRKIWTAEDPVEISQPGLQQVQVNSKIGLDFAAALRSFLRADPDVIMIGEMRDPETAHSGVEASLTGHLVFSTLHTNSAAETVVRLLDLGIDPVSFSDALLGVLAQRLVRTLCTECKKPYAPDDEECKLLMRYYGEEYFKELSVQRKGLEFYKAVGCEACANTGYRGRMGIHELLVASPAMKELIYRKATAGELLKLAMREGMRTLVQDGIRKLLQGHTDLAQVRKVAAA